MDPAFKRELLDFGLEIIQLASALPRTPAGSVLAKQVVIAGTSVGANFEEAEGALTRKDWLHYFNVAKKEAKETHYWIALIKRAKLVPEDVLRTAEPKILRITNVVRYLGISLGSPQAIDTS